MSDKNNFHSGEGQLLSKYKLFVAYKRGTVAHAKYGETITRYSFNTGNQDIRKKKLIDTFFSQYQDQVHTALLYDNQTKNLLQTLKNEKKNN